MKIILEGSNHNEEPLYSSKISVSIEISNKVFTLNEVMNELVKPVLIAYGFCPDAVNSIIIH